MAKNSKIGRIKLYVDAFDEAYKKSFDKAIENKNMEWAAENRRIGNIEFRAGKYYDAMKHYTRAITYCNEDTELISLLYANRSIVCLKMGRYEDCLKNIEMAKARYPKKMLNKLALREKTAKQFMAEQPATAAKESVRLSYDSHANIPSLAKCLDIRYNSLHATQNLQPNDIVLIEKPFAVLQSNTFDQCAYCLRETFATISCQFCDHGMFCDDECRRAAYNSFHKYECGILCLLHASEVDILMGLRCAFVALQKTDLHELKKLFGENSKANAFNPLFEYRRDANYERVSYKCLVNIKTPPVHRYPETLTTFTTDYQHAVLFAIGYVVRHIKSRLPIVMKDDEYFLYNFLYLHLESASNLIKNMNMKPLKGEQKKISDKVKGFAMHGLASYIKISCKPNVEMYYDEDNVLVVKVIKPIPKGDQLFGSFK